MKFTGRELLTIWRQGNMSQRQLADKLGLNFNSMHGLIFRAQQEEDALSDDNIDVKTKGNYKTISAVTRKIKSEQDLIEVCGLDLEVWQIEEFKIKTWEGYRKDVDQDMEFDAGRITGHKVDKGKINTETMFSVEARLVKRNPVPVKPVINPVSFGIKLTKPRKSKRSSNYKKALFISDTQVGFSRDLYTGELTPYHDRLAMSIILSVVKDIHFDVIAMGGDGIDAAEWSTKYVRTPEMKFTTQPAIYELGWFLGQISLLSPQSRKKYIEGNHEYRFPEFYHQHAQHMLRLRKATQFSGDEITSLAYMLDLEGLGWGYIGGYKEGDAKLWLRPDLLLEHGKAVSNRPGGTVAAVVEKSQVTRVFGHIHRREVASRNRIDGTGVHSVSAVSPGCLCRIDGVVPGSNDETNWQQGFAIIEYNDEGFIPPQIVPIEDGKAHYNGKEYHAWDYYDDLRADTKENL
jgi:hypothetical protein